MEQPQIETFEIVENVMSADSSTSGYSDMSSSNAASVENISLSELEPANNRPTLAFSNISYSITSGWKRKRRHILHPMR